MFPVPSSAWFLLSDTTAAIRKYVANEVLKCVVSSDFQSLETQIFDGSSVLESYLVNMRKDKDNDFVSQHIIMYCMSIVFYWCQIYANIKRQQVVSPSHIHLIFWKNTNLMRKKLWLNYIHITKKTSHLNTINWLVREHTNASQVDWFQSVRNEGKYCCSRNFGDLILFWACSSMITYWVHFQVPTHLDQCT